MAEENLTILMESEPKEQAETLFESLGLDLSAATGLFYRQALRCHGLPFDVVLREPNETTYAAVKAADENEDMHGPFDTVSARGFK